MSQSIYASIYQKYLEAKCTQVCYDCIIIYLILQFRGVLIIDISAADMVLFTNISIGEKQHDDRYCYRYLYSSI